MPMRVWPCPAMCRVSSAVAATFSEPTMSYGRSTAAVAGGARWDLHPETTISDRFPLDQVAAAYRTADTAAGGKVAVVMA